MKLHWWAPIDGRATASISKTATAPMKMMIKSMSIRFPSPSIIVLVLAFQLAILLPQTIVCQNQAAGVVGADEHNGGAGLMSLNSDSSSALESSGGDDLLAAESSQAPSDGSGSVSVAPAQQGEHKAAFRQQVSLSPSIILKYLSATLKLYHD